MKFKNPKGTKDYFEKEMAIQRKVFDSLRGTALKFGFKEVEPPVVESFELLAAKQGEEIKNQIFTIEKKGDERLALRAEFTPSLVRMFIDEQKKIPKPVKWFTINKVWRYERPQSGRDREFFQFNCELIGSDKPESDAEVISVIIESLKSLGLKENQFVLKINNSKLLQGIVENFSKKVDGVIRVIDKRAKVDEKDFLEMLKDEGVKNPKELVKILDLKDIVKIKKLELNDQAKEGAEEMGSIMDLLDNKCVELSLSTARGLAYYTGTVFEVFDKDEKLRSIAGGGRYDKMIEQFGGEKCPVTGFGMGYSTLLQLLEMNKLVPEIDLGPEYFIAVVDEDVVKDAVKIANKLRENNSVEIDLMRRKLGKQFSYADSIGAKKVIVVGPDEIKEGKVKIKDMDSGKEKKVEISELK
ncbi:MAG: histidine--tRNA ligase [Candidatus Woesearchaeota archaeon]